MWEAPSRAPFCLTEIGGPSRDAGMTGDEIAALTFEEALKRLEGIVHALESGAASLEDSIGLYAEGQALRAHCEAKLAGATAKIEAIQAGDTGAATGTRPFDAGNA